MKHDILNKTEKNENFHLKIEWIFKMVAINYKFVEDIHLLNIPN